MVSVDKYPEEIDLIIGSNKIKIYAKYKQTTSLKNSLVIFRA